METIPAVAAQQLVDGRGRAGPRIEQRDRHLAPGEGVVEDGKVPDDQGQESEPDPGLKDGQGARHRPSWRNVSQPEGEEGRAAQIEVRAERRRLSRRVDRRDQRPLQQPEPEHQARSPKHQEEHEREGSVESEEGLAPRARDDPARDGRPRLPGQTVKEARQAPPAGDAPGQYDDLEGIPKDDPDKNDGDQGNRETHLLARHDCPSPLPLSVRLTGSTRVAAFRDLAFSAGSAPIAPSESFLW